MKTKKPINSEDAKELRAIREAFKVSRPQFAEVFLGCSKNAVNFYENEICAVPQPVLRTARIWYNFLQGMKGRKNEK
jgi:DNA-binding transcriptional regulator YiaG